MFTRQICKTVKSAIRILGSERYKKIKLITYKGYNIFGEKWEQLSMSAKTDLKLWLKNPFGNIYPDVLFA